MKFCYASKKLPPSGDMRNKVNFTTKTFYNTPDYRQFQMRVKESFLESELAKQLLEPFEGDVEFEYTICPGRTRTDLDNFAKSMLDSAVRAGILKDDSQVTKILATKCLKCRHLKRGEKCLYSFHCTLHLLPSEPFLYPCISS